MSCKRCKKYKREITVENWDSILDELIQDTEILSLSYISGGCPLAETKEHIFNETKYAIIQNFRCGCGSRVEWGVCIRGAPILRVHKK